ncbi:MAG: type III secretion system outer membrane ring subunit SctC [Pseudomonadota bacterium]
MNKFILNFNQLSHLTVSKLKCVSQLKALKINFFKSLVLIAGVLISTLAQADWQQIPYEHFADKESLPELLGHFSAAIDRPMILSEAVIELKGQPFSGSLNADAGDVLNQLGRIYQLTWFDDGYSIYIYKDSETQSRMISLSAGSASTLQKELETLGLWNERYGWRQLGDTSVMISGPPRYLELVAELATGIDARQVTTKNGEFTIRVFPLRYAWAADRTIPTRSGELIIPGIATSLRNMILHIPSSSYATSSTNVATRPDQVKPMNAWFDKRSSVAEKNLFDPSQNANQLSQAPPPVPPTNYAALSSASAEGAYVEAHAQQNAVMVYDRPARMVIYENLIKALDVSQQQIEIEVSILDISTERLLDFGVNWQTNGSSGRVGFGNPNELYTETNGLSGSFGDSVPLSTVLSGNVDYFLSKVRVLAEDGEAQVLSQPKVLTLDNQQAVIDNSSTFFVRLQGQEEVDLVPISVGSVLQVTPRIISAEVGASDISLSVDIQDGQRNATTEDVDDIPSVSTSVISTQAVVGEDSSLLVGGYYLDRRGKTVQKVPFLGDVPVLKYLFSNENRDQTQFARLFLITPRIVTPQRYPEIYQASEKTQRIVAKEKTLYPKRYAQPQLGILD